MAILGSLLKKGIRIRESIEQEKLEPQQLQCKELKKLLAKAQQTAIGKDFSFTEILAAGGGGAKELYRSFKENVPVHDYNKMYNSYWHRTRTGEKDVCWPGQVKYFALSSGTSEAASKYIPVTNDMLRAIRRTSVRQILSLSHYKNLPSDLFTTNILMLGGSTLLNHSGSYYEGDLSGITASKLPFWFQGFYKPGQKIAKERNWEEKLNEITRQAKDWNIGVIVGVPAWIQILIEKIIAYYKVDTIHDIWPNLSIFVHGGVAFEPYKKSFEKLLARPITYMETYLASEGFIAFQAYPNRRSMRLVLNNGIFHEFVPFTEKNFGPDGQMVEKPETCMIDEVEEGKEYALLLTTCSGAYRYLIGDVIKFVSKKESEIIITGRTKHFLSLCGEHLSVDNMNRAIQLVAEELDTEINEFTVAGIPYESLFAHHWIIGTDKAVEPQVVKERLDTHLKALNDDYATERSAALKEVLVDVVPVQAFYKFLKQKGKEGGQHKFPRVIKSQMYQELLHFIEEERKNEWQQ
ncbi:GH3 family domain-containing protein [Nafulsella turpanensis]|uniref:GH3 family domain-containing protein n=1 Tax=Nafulsella turpanensis TaxID=1265690 RepID=UPI0003498E9E|nr:GH3 auxin-responsive promoter family protein [Nafulsella turpanensis]